MYKPTRTLWIATLISLGCILAFAGLWYGYRSKWGGQNVVVQTRSPEEIRSAWKAGVTEALQGFDQEKNPHQAKARLLALTVPSEGRDTHLALVLAFEARIQERADADERLQAARSLFEGATP